MEYLDMMKKIQNYILDFIDEEGDESYQNLLGLKSFLVSRTRQLDKYELKSILYLISKITKNHYRCSSFFDKIKEIIKLFKEEIKQTFFNSDIFNIFKNNKLVLLILFDEEIITIDQSIHNMIKAKKYEEYFLPEIQQSETSAIELPENYEEKRRKGENDSYVCDLIRNDNIVDFVVYYNKTLISLDMKIQDSIYETNSFLLKQKPTLIEYSAFYGSIEIFNFLRMNKVELSPSLWIYSIHGKNAEIVHILEENHLTSNDQTYDECLKESIKCHHNDFAIYYKNNFYKDVDISSNYLKNFICYGFRFYNFQFIPNKLKEKFCFFYAVQFDYYKLIDYFKDIAELDINEMVILKIILNQIQKY